MSHILCNKNRNDLTVCANVCQYFYKDDKILSSISFSVMVLSHINWRYYSGRGTFRIQFLFVAGKVDFYNFYMYAR